jgi:hypothetical protein
MIDTSKTPVKQSGFTNLSTPLETLAEGINCHHEATKRAYKQAILNAQLAGEMLIDAKSRVDHGQWLHWLSENCPTLAARTASGYMRIARNWDTLESKSAMPADLTINDAMRLLSADSQTEAFPGISEDAQKVRDSAQKALDDHREFIEKVRQLGAWRANAASFDQYLAQVGMPDEPTMIDDGWWCWMNPAEIARGRILADVNAYQGRGRA